MSKYRVYNEILCPEFWDGQHRLDPEIRKNLLYAAMEFYKKTKLTLPLLDVYLMGSIANYNWNDYSDADVHIIIDFKQLSVNPETIQQMARVFSAMWNLEHDISIKKHKLELNIQDVNERKPHVGGIYSLLKNMWLRKPKNDSSKIDKDLIKLQYMAMKKYVEASLNGPRETMKDVKKYLDAYRQYGLDTNGELSTENIVFKILRSKGIIKKLKDTIISTYDKELSIWEISDIPLEGDIENNKK